MLRGGIMKFRCFYYPTITKDNILLRCDKEIVEFEFGDKVPTKTIYYNYGKSFVIYQDEQFYVVENEILKEIISPDELKFPLHIVFGKGRQMKVLSKKDLPSIRLLLKGEYEEEKELGELFCLSLMLNRKIRNVQYEVMSDLTNSSRDYIYINEEIEKKTESLLKELKIVENKFNALIYKYPNLKESYLNYMNFKDEEDMLEISINKYFKENTPENKRYKMLCEKWDKKPIHPKVKLDNFINECNLNLKLGEATQ